MSITILAQRLADLQESFEHGRRFDFPDYEICMKAYLVRRAALNVAVTVGSVDPVAISVMKRAVSKCISKKAKHEVRKHLYALLDWNAAEEDDLDEVME